MKAQSAAYYFGQNYPDDAFVCWLFEASLPTPMGGARRDDRFDVRPLHEYGHRRTPVAGAGHREPGRIASRDMGIVNRMSNLDRKAFGTWVRSRYERTALGVINSKLDTDIDDLRARIERLEQERSGPQSGPDPV